MSPRLAQIAARRAELLRALAETEAAFADAVAEPLGEGQKPDEVLSLDEAAALFGEPRSTFRQRPEYRKALVSRRGERRLRYSRAALERIKADRLAAS